MEETAANTPEAAAPEAVPAAPPEESSAPAPEPTQNLTKEMSRRLQKEKLRARNELVTELLTPLLGLKDYAEYERWRQSEETSPAERLRQSLTAGAREQEALLRDDLSLASQPEIGPLYRQHRQEVRQIAAENACDLNTAWLLLLEERLPEILARERTAAEQRTLQALGQAAIASPGSMQEASTARLSYSELSKGDFAQLLERVKKGKQR